MPSAAAMNATAPPPPASRWLDLPAVVCGGIAALVLAATTGAVLLHFHLSLRQQADANLRNALRKSAIACSLAVDPAVVIIDLALASPPMADFLRSLAGIPARATLAVIDAGLSDEDFTSLQACGIDAMLRRNPKLDDLRPLLEAARNRQNHASRIDQSTRQPNQP